MVASDCPDFVLDEPGSTSGSCQLLPILFPAFNGMFVPLDDHHTLITGTRETLELEVQGVDRTVPQVLDRWTRMPAV
jgi:hypothetical protein